MTSGTSQPSTALIEGLSPKVRKVYTVTAQPRHFLRYNTFLTIYQLCSPYYHTLYIILGHWLLRFYFLVKELGWKGTMRSIPNCRNSDKDAYVIYKSNGLSVCVCVWEGEQLTIHIHARLQSESSYVSNKFKPQWLSSSCPLIPHKTGVKQCKNCVQHKERTVI